MNCISKQPFQQQENNKLITDLGPFTYSCSASGQLLNPPPPLVQAISQEIPFLPDMSISVHGKIISSNISDMLLNSASANVAKPKSNVGSQKDTRSQNLPEPVEAPVRISVVSYVILFFCRGLYFCKS